MKIIITGCLSLFIFAAFAFTSQSPHGSHEEAKTLAIGDPMPGGDMKMVDVNGTEQVPLSTHMGENGLLVVFSCNTCPFVVAYEDRLPEIQAMAKKMDIGFVVVNSNEAKRKEDDSEKAMKEYTKKWRLDSPYLIDTDSKVADLFGAFVTPEVFLFNPDSKLEYKGAIDDNWKSKDAVEVDYLQIAMTAVINGDEIEVKETKARGCSIKRLK